MLLACPGTVVLLAKATSPSVEAAVGSVGARKASRMRNKLTRVYALIGAEVGMDTWIETQTS